MRYGKQFLCVLCDAFGEKEMLGFLKTVEHSMVKMKSVLLNVLHDWMIVHNWFSLSNLLEFLELLSLRSSILSSSFSFTLFSFRVCPCCILLVY